MATIYVNPNVAGTGSGTLADPYKSTSSITPSAGDTIAIAKGTVLREQIATAAIAANNLTITSYGTGDAPIISGAEIVSSWSATAVPGIFSTTLGSNLGGNVSENGLPMTCVFFNTNIATTAPSIPTGGFSFDTANYIVYIRPTGGLPTNNTYEVSQRLYGIYSTASYSGLTVTGLSFRNQSRNSIYLINRSTTNINNNQFCIVGGYRSGGVSVGNAVELSYSCNSSKINYNTFEDIFDVAATYQIYNNSVSISDCEIIGNSIKRTGFYGIEISIVGAVTNSSLVNIKVTNNTVELAGYAWRPTDVTGRGIHVDAAQATSTISNVLVSENTLKNCRWGLSENTRGSTSSGVVFSRNVVTTDRTPANGRGIFITGPVLFTSNIVDGYTYGIYPYGTSGTPVMKCHYNVCVNCVNGVLQDGTTGTIELRNNFFWHTGQWVSNFQNGMTRDFEYNSVRAASGSVTTGMTLSGTNLRPTTYQLASPSYYPISGSSLINAGTFTEYTCDFFKVARRNPPTMGAYEYVNVRGTR